MTLLCIFILQNRRQISLFLAKMHPNKRFFGKKSQENLVVNNIFRTFAAALAQMAELVDALVSNTNTSRCTGSSPVLGTQNTMAKFLINYY